MNKTCSLTLVACAVMGFLGAARTARADIVIENEADGMLTNNFTGLAQDIPGAAFTLPVPATVFDPPGFPTATIRGAGSSADVDFYSFMSTVPGGGRVYFDVDNDPFDLDTILALFDSAGTLLGIDDDSFPEDPGTLFGFDSFLGVYTLPGPGTYFVAVSSFSSVANLPEVLAFDMATQFAELVRPDGEFGGEAVLDAPVGNSFYEFNASQIDGSPYTLHISLEAPGVEVIPEPASLTLCGLGIVGLWGYAWKRRAQSV